MSLIDLIPGGAEAKLIAAAVGVAAAFGLGITADRVAPWVGANAQEKALNATISTKDQALGRASAALTSAALAISTRDAAIAGRDKLLVSNGKTETTDASQTSTFWKGQARVAYDEGYAARVCTPGGDPPGVVRNNLGQLWDSGRYAPGSAAPASGSPGGGIGSSGPGAITPR